MGEGQDKVTIVLCWTFCFVVIAQGRLLRDVTTNQGESLTTFQVTRITRQSSNNGHNVELHLSGTDPDLPTVYLTHNRHQQPERLGKPSNGVLRFHVDSPVKAIQLLHPRGYQAMNLGFSDNSPTEQVLPHIDFTLQEGREVAFQQGQDADVHFRVSVDKNSPTEVTVVYVGGGMAVKSTTEDQVVEIHADYSQFPLNVLNHTYADNGGSAHLRINTSAGNVEGLVQVDAFAAFSCMDESACLIPNYFIHEDVPVYQEGHDGPFADNYIGLQKYAHHHVPNSIECYVNDPHSCRMRCEFIGDGPTPVQFEKVSGDDLGPNGVVSVANEGFWARGVLTFDNITSPGEAEYRCRSSSGQQQASHIITVKAVESSDSPSEKRDLREATMMQDGTV